VNEYFIVAPALMEVIVYMQAAGLCKKNFPVNRHPGFEGAESTTSFLSVTCLQTHRMSIFVAH
jgi:hypothetical protein